VLRVFTLFLFGKSPVVYPVEQFVNLVPESIPLRFLMAVVAAFTISFSLASMASIAGLLSQPTVNQKAPAFMTPLAGHLQAAARLAGRTDAAPAVQRDLLTPAEVAIDAALPALIDAPRQASIKQ
jgi:hypothetical protein